MIRSITKVLVADPTPIVALGCEAVLRRANKFRTQVLINPDLEELIEAISTYKPDLVIVNPLICGVKLDSKILPHIRDTKVIGLLYGGMQELKFVGYHAFIDVDCKEDVLLNLINSQLDAPTEKAEERTALSPREENVVTLVAKGLTNKEIAAKLSLSIHTVITHRRNIAKKLQIHSPSGLTIYAITNKLVSIDETKL